MQTLMPLADTDLTECGSKPVPVFMFCTMLVIVPSVSRPPVAAVWCATSEGGQVLPEVELDQHRAAQKPGTRACSRERGEGIDELPALGTTAPVGLAGDLVHGHPHRLGHDDRAEHQICVGRLNFRPPSRICNAERSGADVTAAYGVGGGMDTGGRWAETAPGLVEGPRWSRKKGREVINEHVDGGWGG